MYNYGLGNPGLGNYYNPYETEEERRRREEAESNTLLGKQEVETYADGSQTIKTTQEVPAQPAITPVRVSPVQQMPVAQPVAPVVPETYGRMIQAESAGRDFDAQGRPLTSPKGALFAAQVMPQTAAQPGYGIRPAAAQTPEEYNRVGQEYFQAMLGQFGGDQQKAAAAYNAGPGRIQQAERQAAEKGGSWMDYIPRETMQYVGKVFEGMIPSAQAAQPVAPSAGAGRGVVGMPQAVPGEGVAVATGQGVQGTMAARPNTVAQQQAIVTGQAQPVRTSEGYIANYQEMQDDPEQLLALRKDTNAPEWIRKRAGERAYELMNAEVKKAESTQQAQQLAQAAAQGDRKASMTIARELQKQEGSWLKMILLGFISPQLAGEEAVKLGFGNKWTNTTDLEGKPVLLQTNARGLPLKGYRADGTAIPEDQLVAIGGQAAGRQLDIVGGTFVNDTTGEVGRVVTDKKTGQSYIQTDSGPKPMTGFRPQSATGTAADQRARALQDLNIKLQGKTAEEAMAILRPYNQQLVAAGYPRVQPDELGIRAPQVGAPAAGAVPVPPGQAPAMAAAPMAAPGGPVAPSPAGQPAPAAQMAPTRPTGPQMAAGAEARKTIAEAAGKVVADEAKLISDINGGNRAIDILRNKNTNFGGLLQGQLPGEQTVGKFLGTQESQNTRNVLEYVDKLNAAGAKALGTNPTDRDLQFLLANAPNVGTPAEEVASWIERVQERIRDNIEIARKQVETGGAYQPPVPQGGGTKSPAAGTTSSGNTAMTPAERARAELERRKKERQ